MAETLTPIGLKTARLISGDRFQEFVVAEEAYGKALSSKQTDIKREADRLIFAYKRAEYASRLLLSKSPSVARP